MSFEERILEIRNKQGLHARAANMIVQIANDYKSTITVEKDGIVANGKSIMNILLLAARKGEEITLRVEGEDAREAIEALSRVIKDKFGEQ